MFSVPRLQVDDYSRRRNTRENVEQPRFVLDHRNLTTGDRDNLQVSSPHDILHLVSTVLHHQATHYANSPASK